MASTIHDRWLWLGLGVVAFVALKGVEYGLHEVASLARTEEYHRPKKSPSPSSENAIKTESLETLALCSNVDIRKAATDLLCNRFLTDKEAHRLLSEDYHSGDRERQASAIKCLHMLREYGVYTNLANPDHPRVETAHQLRLQQSRELQGVRHRPVVDTTEEQALRRRRREAMVLNEGDRPVSQEDIIQGGGGMSVDEVRVAEQALETLTRREREFASGSSASDGVQSVHGLDEES